MRTGRSLTVCQSLLPVGCMVLGGAQSQGSACSRGVSAPRGPGLWGAGLGGGAWSRGVVSQHALRQTLTPPHVNRMTDRCKKYYLGHNFVAAGKNNKIQCVCFLFSYLVCQCIWLMVPFNAQSHVGVIIWKLYSLLNISISQFSEKQQNQMLSPIEAIIYSI